MRKLLWLFITILCCSQAWATFTLVQHPNHACAAASTCAVTITAVSAGDLIIVFSAWGANNQTLSTPTLTGQTFTHCSNCDTNSASDGRIDLYYVLSTASNATTTLTCNYSGSNGSAVCALLEYSYTNGPVSVDQSGNLPQSATTSAPPGVGFSGGTALTGNNDIIFQGGNGSGTLSAINGAYTNVADFPTGTGIAAAINTTTGTAPTWTASSGTYVVDAIAFKDSSTGGPSGGSVVGGKINLGGGLIL